MVRRVSSSSSAAGTLWIASLATALPCASVYMSQAIFPEIAAGLGVEAAEARLAFTVTSSAYALAFFLFGPLSDRTSARTVGGLACIPLAGAHGLIATVDGFTGFLALATLVGVVAAAIPAAMYALVGRVVPQERLGAGMGMIIAASVVGVILGRALAGMVAEAWGWRMAFLGMAGCYLVLLVALAFLPTEPAPADARPSVGRVFANGVRLLTDLRVVRLLAIGFLLFVGYLGVLSILTLRLYGAPFHYDAGQIGWLSLLGLVAVAGAPLAGRALPRLGARVVLTGGLILVLAALALLAIATGPLPLVLGILLMFLGVFACQPVMFTLLAATVPPEAKGTSSSLYFLVCLGSGGISTAALGPIWSHAGWGGDWGGVIAAGSVAVSAALILARWATRIAPTG